MIHNLQALRALAAWMVVLHHLRVPLADIWVPLGQTMIFAAGVDIFFVLSGFVIVASTRDRKIEPLAFWRRRLVRIVPLYWAVTIAIVAMLLIGLSPVGIAGWTARDVASSLLFLGVERSDGYPGPLLGVGWTLAYEAFFYLLFGAALWLRASPALSTGAMLAALVGFGWLAAPDSFAARFYTAPILLEFVAGAMLAHVTLTRGGGPLLASGLLGLVAGAAVLATLVPGGDLITPGGYGAGWRTLCFGLPAAMIVAGAAALEAEGVTCENGFVLDQGDASYALYLLHLPLIQIIEKAAGPMAMLLIAPPILAITAHAVHQWGERPAMAILRPRRFDLRRYRLAG